MNARDIVTVYRKELKDMLRDRRALLSMIIIPTFLMPALTFGVAKIAVTIFSTARAETPTVMVLGGEDSPGVVAQLRQSDKFEIVPSTADWKTRISDKKVRGAVEIPAGFEAGLRTGTAPPVVIYHYEGELKSGFAANALGDFFRALRERTVADRLAARSLPATLVRPFDVRRENVAPPEKVGGNLLGGILPYFVIILCYTGAMYPALDLTAGEKERGTMETLLCSPVARIDLVLGKFFMVLTGSLSAMLLSLVSLGGSAMAAGLLFGGGRAGAAASSRTAGALIPTIDPLGLLGVVGMILPVAVLFSAVVFTVALFAKTQKEAQSYVGPLMIIVILPAVVGMLPGIDLDAGLACVPVLNLSLVCRELLSGVWHWPYLAIIFGSSCFYAALALLLAVRMFRREDVIFRT